MQCANGASWRENDLTEEKKRRKHSYPPQNCDPKALKYALSKGAIEYENFLESGDLDFAWTPPEDEWQSIALGYTSGTTASPKGVVLHHRGVYLMSLSGAVVWGMNEGAVYLWTLPMVHCNGWCYTWTLAVLCGINIYLRQVIARAMQSRCMHTCMCDVKTDDPSLPVMIVGAS